MKRIFLLPFACFLLVQKIYAQSVAINTDGTTAHSSAILDIKSTNKGLLVPRMTSTERTAITSPAQGLFVFDLTTNSFWYYNENTWNNLAQQASVPSAVWMLNGNSGTNPSTDFIGTTDNQSLNFRIDNQKAGLLSQSNTAFDYHTLYSNTAGNHNVAIGVAALKANTVGHFNTAFGFNALYSNVNTDDNTAIGGNALYHNIGGGNTALGTDALYSNVTGSGNIAIGKNSDVRNNGSNVIAIGAVASSNEIVLGNNSYTKFFCQATYSATTSFAPNLYVECTGQIMRVTSSARYKEDIDDLEINTSKIYELRPVSFTSKNDKTRHFGLIAEEVAQTIPELANFVREKDVIQGSTSEKLIPDAVQYPMLWSITVQFAYK